VVGSKVTAVTPIRNALIAKGMAYGPAHGDSAFIVPLSDGFTKCITPLAMKKWSPASPGSHRCIGDGGSRAFR